MRVAICAHSLCLGLLALAGCTQNPYLLQSKNKSLQQEQVALQQRSQELQSRSPRSITITRSSRPCWLRPASKANCSKTNWWPCANSYPELRPNWHNCATKSRSPKNRPKRWLLPPGDVLVPQSPPIAAFPDPSRRLIYRESKPARMATFFALNFPVPNFSNQVLPRSNPRPWHC